MNLTVLESESRVLIDTVYVEQGTDNVIDDELSGLVGEPDYTPDASSTSETEVSGGGGGDGGNCMKVR